MSEIKEIEKRRDELLERMKAIRSMRKGTINEQYMKVYPKGKKKPSLRGPYYVISRREGGRTVSERLTSPADLERAREEVTAHKRFLSLCKQFETLTERLGELERSGEDMSLEKKRSRSPSSKAKR
ncbi:MAG: hypothetical protein DRI30_08520 [Chloroflexi bacterium]|nr:MAG: hypothetical protein DRI30_08520 [Chloroflexota bacterium]